MPTSGRAAVISAVAGWIPPEKRTNADLAPRLGVSVDWIRSRTGITTRRVVTPGTATSDLAVEAGRRAVEAAGGSEVQAVVLATTTPDHPCPATAPDVAARIGLSGVAAFDVSAVCTGFLYALATAQGLIAAGTVDAVLVIGADAFTTIVDPTDRSTAILFGDGAGAVVLRAGESTAPGALGPILLGSDGSDHPLIQVPGGGSRQRSTGQPATPGDNYFQMDGRRTFRRAVEQMTEVSQKALAAVRWRPDDVDRLATHQANARIIAMVGDALEVPAERRLSNIDRVGNTGAASIPLLLAQAAADGRLRAGHRTLLTAFGGGLTWGATTVVWPDLPTPVTV
ncbi:beta-ketoacyl-ACP synthase III [Micromonospora sp. NPDC003197]